jgi:hypothetical protein
MAPDVGFEPTIRRGGLTVNLWERLEKVAAAASFQPALTAECFTSGWVFLFVD